MGTVIDYIRECGDVSFGEKPMNDVDSLILSQFSYLKFDGMVPGLERGAKLADMGWLAGHEQRDGLFADERFRKENMALFEAMLSSRRYSGLRMNYYCNLIDPEKESQFSAITFLLDDGTVYIAYRGTDETIVGWKEDFNLAFSEPVPSQLYSVEYMKQVSRRFFGDFYTGGHSKGGNLAVYAAMNCGSEIQGRIVRIYSHDGPGFRPEVRERCGYAAIAGKVAKIIPHSSMVGMLLEDHADYEVVESKGIGLIQHDPFTWLVKGDDFVRVKAVYAGRKFMDEALNAWILSLDEEHIHLFVDTLYEVISASRAETLIDFTADWKKSMNGVLNALKEIDPETKDMLKKIIRSLFDRTALRPDEDSGEEMEGSSGGKKKCSGKDGVGEKGMRRRKSSLKGGKFSGTKKERGWRAARQEALTAESVEAQRETALEEAQAERK